jgi:hypothetical protein
VEHIQVARAGAGEAKNPPNRRIAVG